MNYSYIPNILKYEIFIHTSISHTTFRHFDEYCNPCAVHTNAHIYLTLIPSTHA